jgi:hypothetical protein
VVVSFGRDYGLQSGFKGFAARGLNQREPPKLCDASVDTSFEDCAGDGGGGESAFTIQDDTSACK